MNRAINVSKNRNYGIDLLRIFSMFMVVLLHVLGRGGVIASTTKFSLSYELLWLIEIMAYCAVNCYAIISGYVSYGSKFKFSSIALLWLQVAFYSVIITAIFAVIDPDLVTVKHFINAVFPVTMRQYWYFTAYFALYFLTPVLNAAVENLSRGQLNVTVTSILVLFSVLPTVFNFDPFQSDQGYSLIWLVVLYVLGAYIRKYDCLSKVSAKAAILTYFVCVLINWISKYCVDKKIPVLRNIHLVEYISPTMVLSAIALIIFFSRIKAGDRAVKIITVISPLAFGVYLIHTQKLIWKNYLTKAFVSFAELSTPLLILAVLGTALAIFCICIVIEFGRDKLFKILDVKNRLLKLESAVKKRANL